MMIAPHHRAVVDEFIADLTEAVANPATAPRTSRGYNT
jgi:hypothetical protein